MLEGNLEYYMPSGGKSLPMEDIKPQNHEGFNFIKRLFMGNSTRGKLNYRKQTQKNVLHI